MMLGMNVAEDSREIDVEPARVAAWMSSERPPQVIDVREPYEREAGHIDGSRSVPLGELTAQAASVERERPVVFYCRVGARSEMAAQAFRAAGFEAYTMSGGLLRWAQEGRALTPEDGHVAQH
jgi:hydroxyacylglutathione hydrolase/adenylyltransferase/sulfurtransferase